MGELNLEAEISSFYRLLPSLRANRQNGWVVIVGEECAGSFSTFEQAAEFAVGQFPEKHFLIRHTDEPPAQVPFVVVEG